MSPGDWSFVDFGRLATDDFPARPIPHFNSSHTSHTTQPIRVLLSVGSPSRIMREECRRTVYQVSTPSLYQTLWHLVFFASQSIRILIIHQFTPFYGTRGEEKNRRHLPGRSVCIASLRIDCNACESFSPGLLLYLLDPGLLTLKRFDPGIWGWPLVAIPH